jgi:hypothetical protein
VDAVLPAVAADATIAAVTIAATASEISVRFLLPLPILALLRALVVRRRAGPFR